MSIHPSEEIVKFSFNLPPETFDSMKTEMRLFGSRTKTALKTDLKVRLDEKRKNHQEEALLNLLLKGLDEYRSSIYSNFNDFNSNSMEFNREKNLNAFWHLMNSFLLDLVERPEGVDSVLLEKPVQEILTPYFEEIGYMVEFYVHSLFSDWFPYYNVTVAHLFSRKKMHEQLFGFSINYTLEYIQTLKPSIIFGVSSFFDPRNIKIRIDHSTVDCVCHESLQALMEEEKGFMEEATRKPYKEIVLEHILFHEKMHCMFHMIKEGYYSRSHKEPSAVFSLLMLSEVWARLASLYLSNGAIIFELNSLMVLRNVGDPVYYATHEFLVQCTSIFEVFRKTGKSLDESIRLCRFHALKSLQMTANWMNRYLVHTPEKRWYEIIYRMQQEYDRDEIGLPQIHKKYRPELHA